MSSLETRRQLRQRMQKPAPRVPELGWPLGRCVRSCSGSRSARGYRSNRSVDKATAPSQSRDRRSAARAQKPDIRVGRKRVARDESRRYHWYQTAQALPWTRSRARQKRVIGGFAIGPPAARTQGVATVAPAAGCRQPGRSGNMPHQRRSRVDSVATCFGCPLIPTAVGTTTDAACCIMSNQSTRVMLSAGRRAGVVRRQPLEPNDDEAAQRLP